MHFHHIMYEYVYILICHGYEKSWDVLPQIIAITEAVK